MSLPKRPTSCGHSDHLNHQHMGQGVSDLRITFPETLNTSKERERCLFVGVTVYVFVLCICVCMCVYCMCVCACVSHFLAGVGYEEQGSCDLTSYLSNIANSTPYTR